MIHSNRSGTEALQRVAGLTSQERIEPRAGVNSWETVDYPDGGTNSTTLNDGAHGLDVGAEGERIRTPRASTAISHEEEFTGTNPKITSSKNGSPMSTAPPRAR
jgi:hypothetical protein